MISTDEMPGPKRSRKGRGALFVVTCFLLASALLRLGDSAGQALARSSEPDDSASGASNVQSSCETPEDLKILLTAIQERESRLAEREASIEDRMQALDLADREISGKLMTLTHAEEQLRQTIALAETAAEDDLTRLTKVYETMKPKQAAALFETMDPIFAAGFLARMKPDAAAAIMAGLTPGAAHKFSVVLAGRNADVPTE